MRTISFKKATTNKKIFIQHCSLCEKYNNVYHQAIFLFLPPYSLPICIDHKIHSPCDDKHFAEREGLHHHID